MEIHRTQNNKKILKNDKIRGLKTTDFKINYKILVIKRVWYWHQDDKQQCN